MAKSIADQLMERRARLITEAQEIAQKGVAEGRDLSVEEQTGFDQRLAEADKLATRAEAIAEGEKRAGDLEASFRDATGADPQRGGGEHRESGLGKWAAEARVGDTFVVQSVRGAEKRALNRMRGGEQRAMSATGGTGPDGVYGQLWEYAVATSQLLQAGVDIINTSDGNTLPFPRATVHAAPSPSAIPANDPIPQVDSTINTVDLSVAKYGFLTLVPTELVQDATFDLEGYIARNAGRQLGRKVANIAAAAMISDFTVAGATTPATILDNFGSQSEVGQGTDLIYALYHSVLPEYRSTAAFTMNDATAAIVRSLKGNDGQTVWQPALTAGDPDLLVGKPVYYVPELDVPAAGAKSVFFGDLSALKVRIAGGMRFERSDEYAFGNDQIAFRAQVRTGSVGLDPNAVKFLQNAAV